MAPRLSICRYSRPIATHSSAISAPRNQIPLCHRIPPRRLITSDEKPLPKAPKDTVGPNQEQLPHVSEEAAATGKVTGEGGPELEQGTPVQEVSSSFYGTRQSSHSWLSRCSNAMRRHKRTRQKSYKTIPSHPLLKEADLIPRLHDKRRKK